MAIKQKLNKISVTEPEMVGVHDAICQFIWFRYFIMAQGVKVTQKVLFQDNKSVILLHRNSTTSSSSNSRHFNIRYFFVKDRIRAGEVDVVYCPSENMNADFFTNPIQGKGFSN
jgi:hypothetical protein